MVTCAPNRGVCPWFLRVTWGKSLNTFFQKRPNGCITSLLGRGNIVFVFNVLFLSINNFFWSPYPEVDISDYPNETHPLTLIVKLLMESTTITHQLHFLTTVVWRILRDGYVYRTPQTIVRLRLSYPDSPGRKDCSRVNYGHDDQTSSVNVLVPRFESRNLNLKVTYINWALQLPKL